MQFFINYEFSKFSFKIFDFWLFRLSVEASVGLSAVRLGCHWLSVDCCYPKMRKATAPIDYPPEVEAVAKILATTVMKWN